MVVGLTLAMMVVEIAAGTLFGSMALLADGWHMATHAGALGIAALAYGLARRHRDDARFSFGAGKFGDLAAFGSAVALGLISLGIAFESASRLLAPEPIAFDEAIVVAVLGLGINLVSAWLLHDRDHGPSGHGHDHLHADTHGHAHDHAHDDGDHHHGDHGSTDHLTLHRDHNLHAAYLHVVADAVTSVTAIVALILGREAGLVAADPLIGLLGALLIARWSVDLMRDSAAVLLDTRPSAALEEEVRRTILGVDGGARLFDLHVWRVGPGHRAAIVAMTSEGSHPPSYYKQVLCDRFGFSHVTVEVERRLP